MEETPKRVAKSTNHHMAQSQSELKENKNSRGRNKSTSNQMEMSKLELLDLDPIEVLDWEVEKLEAGLKELGITIAVSWSKSRKAHGLNKALEKIKIDNQENFGMDSNMFMIQALQPMQQQNQVMQAQAAAQQAQMQAQAEAQAEALAAIAEKVSGNCENTNNNRSNKN